ncbi:MAG: alpha/beta fold hydrolase [Candidatus Cryptobacteroides sp.]
MKDMTVFELNSASDGLKISVAAMDPVTAPKAVVQLVHGMCEHKERYFPFMEYLVSKGYACVISDHRGHGASVKSTEDLGYFYAGGWKAAVDDVHMVTLWAKKRYPDIPLILLGHSMGSLIVRSFAKKYDDSIDALVVCGSPSDNPAAGAGKFLARITEIIMGDHHRPEFLQKIAFGAFNSAFPDAKSPNAWVCSDPAVVEAYDADPLCHYVFTANGFKNLFGLVKETYSPKGWKMSNPSMPVRFIAGEKDPCIISPDKFAAAVDFMRKVGYADVTSKLYSGMRHEVLNEKGKGEVWKDVADFIDSVCKKND